MEEAQRLEMGLEKRAEEEGGGVAEEAWPAGGCTLGLEAIGLVWN